MWFLNKVSRGVTLSLRRIQAYRYAMFLGILAGVALALLVGTALLQRRTRRQITGESGLGAASALAADAGGTRDLGREVARQESHAVRHLGEGGGGF